MTWSVYKKIGINLIYEYVIPNITELFLDMTLFVLNTTGYIINKIGFNISGSAINITITM